jgi:hypothetical protein
MHIGAPIPVQLAMSESLKGDASHVEAHHSKRKVLLLVQRHSVNVTCQREEVWSVGQVEQLQQPKHANTTQVCPWVCAL